VAALNGAAVPGWPVWPAGRPGALPPGINGHNYAWAFPTLDAATFWVGVIAQALPAIRVWVFNTGATLATYY